MRKQFPVLALVLFLLSATAGRAAATRIVIRPPDSPVRAGETFSVTVEIEGNPGFDAARFALSGDRGKLECTDVSAGEVLAGTFYDSNPSAPLGAILAAASANAVTRDGILASFDFLAREDLETFEFALTESEFFLNNVPVPFTITGGQQEKSAPVSTQPPPRFTDTEGNWAESYIERAAERGLFSGYPDGSFRPDALLTRGEFMTVLWNLAGRPAADTAAPFKDMADRTRTVQTAVSWAYGKGYIHGTSPDTFTPGGPLTRQAAMKILFGYSGGETGTEALLTGVYDSTFSDSYLIEDWARPGLYWGVYNVIITGTTPTTLNPGGLITRAQLAAIMARYTDRFPITEGG